jgi:hypothetical protein
MSSISSPRGGGGPVPLLFPDSHIHANDEIMPWMSFALAQRQQSVCNFVEHQQESKGYAIKARLGARRGSPGLKEPKG